MPATDDTVEMTWEVPAASRPFATPSCTTDDLIQIKDKSDGEVTKCLLKYGEGNMSAIHTIVSARAHSPCAEPATAEHKRLHLGWYGPETLDLLQEIFGAVWFEYGETCCKERLSRTSIRSTRNEIAKLVFEHADDADLDLEHTKNQILQALVCESTTAPSYGMANESTDSSRQGHCQSAPKRNPNSRF